MAKPLHRSTILLWITLALFDPVASASSSFRSRRRLQEDNSPTASNFPSSAPSVSPTASEQLSPTLEPTTKEFVPTSSEFPTVVEDGTPTVSPTVSEYPTNAPTSAPTATDSPTQQESGDNIFNRNPPETQAPTESPTETSVRTPEPQCSSDCGCSVGWQCKCMDPGAVQRELIDEFDYPPHGLLSSDNDPTLRATRTEDIDEPSSKQSKRTNLRSGGSGARQMKSKSSKRKRNPKKQQQKPLLPPPVPGVEPITPTCESTPLGQCSALTFAMCVPIA